MIRFAICLSAGLGLPCAAATEEAAWVRLSGAEITQALTGKVLEYGKKWQDFRASGRTLYFAGQESWGYWAVRGDQYCSMWPPSDLWACYDMMRHEDRLRFVGQNGDVTEGGYRVKAQ